MTTIQDRIIKDFRNRFLAPPDSDIGWIVKSDINPIFLETVTNKTLKKNLEKFLIKSIKEVEEETRKEVVDECKQKMAQSNEWWNKKLLSITNKEKQK